jgi:opine dehydrogenase
MNITVIGGGNGGKATAADLTLAGHKVTLFEFQQFEENIKPIKENGGINLVGEERNGFARLNKITTDVQEALEGSEIILSVLPAFGNKTCAQVCAPYLTDEQMIVLTPGSTLGSLEFHNTLKENGVKANIKIAETSTLPYAARASVAEVRIILQLKKLWLAAFPAKNTKEILKKFKILYPVTESMRNILEVGLNNGNITAHPGPALLNAGRVEYSKGEFYMYPEGITPHVINVMQAVDDERLALCRKLGYDEIPALERLYITGYSVTKSSLYDAYHTSPTFCGKFAAKGPHNLFDRYYTEETAYALVTLSSLGDLIGVEVPTIKSIITVMSKLLQIDYFSKGERNVEKLGLSQMTIERINHYLDTGEKS